MKRLLPVSKEDIDRMVVAEKRLRPVSTEFSADYGSAPTGRSLGVLQPGAGVSLTTRTAHLTAADIRGVLSGTEQLEVFGKIAYLDVLDRKHTTTFASTWPPPPLKSSTLVLSTTAQTESARPVTPPQA